jgi:hypothetical protein
MLVTIVAVAPNGFEQLHAAKHLLWVLGEIQQEIEFSGGKLQLLIEG